MLRVSLFVLWVCLAVLASPPELVPQSPLDGAASEISVSPGGRYLAAGGRRSSLWDVERGFATALLPPPGTTGRFWQSTSAHAAGAG